MLGSRSRDRDRHTDPASGREVVVSDARSCKDVWKRRDLVAVHTRVVRVSRTDDVTLEVVQTSVFESNKSWRRPPSAGRAADII